MTTALPRRFPTGAPTCAPTSAWYRGTIAAVAALWTLGAAIPAQAQTYAPARTYAGLFDWLDGPRAEVVPDDMPRAMRPKPQIRTQDKTRARKAHETAIKLPGAKVPAGPMQLIVSTARQRVTWYSNGVAVAEAPVSTGVPGHPTPLGIFSVIAKSRHHKSNIYSDAPMPFMHRITWSGIALHQGPLPGRPASHGCIRLPESFASRLFSTSRLGARVIITRDPVAPVAIDSPRLIAPAEAVPVPSADLVPEAQRLIERAAAESGVMEKPAAGPPQTANVQVADVTGSVVDGVPPIVPAPRLVFPAEMPNRKGPVQAFVSRKEGKLYVRQGFAPLFETGVTIADPKQPWGTHVFTVMDIKDGAARWTAITVPSGYAAPAEAKPKRKISAKEAERRAARAYDLAHAPSAKEALEHFTMPDEARQRIAALLAPGSSLIVSDNALSDETGLETDFIVLTH